MIYELKRKDKKTTHMFSSFFLSLLEHLFHLEFPLSKTKKSTIQMNFKTRLNDIWITGFFFTTLYDKVYNLFIFHLATSITHDGCSAELFIYIDAPSTDKWKKGNDILPLNRDYIDRQI